MASSPDWSDLLRRVDQTLFSQLLGTTVPGAQLSPVNFTKVSDHDGTISLGGPIFTDGDDYRIKEELTKKDSYKVLKRAVRLRSNGKEFMMEFEPRDDITMKEYIACENAFEGRVIGSIYKYLVDLNLIRHFVPYNKEASDSNGDQRE